MEADHSHNHPICHPDGHPAEQPSRCSWCLSGPEMMTYHDRVWGKPEHDDQELFALLVLEGMQAGLSWATILKKESAYRRAFFDFDVERVANMTQEEIEERLQDAELIRNRAKLESIPKNARAFQAVQEEFGSFDAYIWGFTHGATIDHKLERSQDAPAQDELSQAISKDLKKRGFTFVGPVIVYSYLQAIGIVNDHETGCAFR